MSELSVEHIDRLKKNLEKVESLSKRLVDVMARKPGHNPALDGPNQELFAKAASSYWAEVTQNPARMLETQIEYWGKSVQHFIEAQQALVKGGLQVPEDTGPTDKRFANPMWDTNPYFNFIKRQYLINAEAIERAVADIGDLDDIEKRRLTYFSRQIVDMMAPTNFLATNPDALEKAPARVAQP